MKSINKYLVNKRLTKPDDIQFKKFNINDKKLELTDVIISYIAHGTTQYSVYANLYEILQSYDNLEDFAEYVIERNNKINEGRFDKIYIYCNYMRDNKVYTTYVCSINKYNNVDFKSKESVIKTFTHDELLKFILNSKVYK